ncbi:MAG: FKBP-type peptidyl-prolyl cis-trans isomerase [Treponema sp.]
MKITKDCLVTLEYTLKDEAQEILDSSEKLGPLDYLHGYNFLISGLERTLEGKEEGEAFSLTVAPEDGYGLINEDMVFEVNRSQFPPEVTLEVGMEFDADNHPVRITAIEGDTITVDANHPLAGETLYFDVKIVSVRTATEEEIAAALEPLTECSCGCGHDHHEHGHDSCGGCSGCH